jgi:hypothetical protein
VGDLKRLFRVVARDDRIGGLAPDALLRRRLSLRRTILICAAAVNFGFNMRLTPLANSTA